MLFGIPGAPPLSSGSRPRFCCNVCIQRPLFAAGFTLVTLKPLLSPATPWFIFPFAAEKMPSQVPLPLLSPGGHGYAAATWSDVTTRLLAGRLFPATNFQPLLGVKPAFVNVFMNEMKL